MGEQDPIAQLLREAEALVGAYSPGHHGRWVARRRAEALDACLIELVRRAGAPPGVAVAALGGYGRSMQLPASDVDVLVVHEGLGRQEVEQLARAVLYPLWDAGLAVGQAVRTPRECVDVAGERLDALTAMLDARFLAGDGALLTRALDPVRHLAARDPRAFAARLVEAAAARRERFGSCAHLLEPDLKEGSGGLRDIASLGWLEAAMGSSLEDAGLLGEHERLAVDAAEEFIVRARSAVHLQTGKRADRLLLELQPDVARDMGFSDEPRLISTDGLMRALFEHARSVEHVTATVLGRALADPATTEPVRLAGPAGVLGALADLAEGGGVPGVGLLEAVERADLPDPVTWDREVRDGFLRLLRAGEGGARMLDALDRLGLLVRFLPAWKDVRCRPQRDPYHSFTVDVHLTATVAAMARLLADAGNDAMAEELLAHLEHPDALLLGALLHDVGKTGEGNHVPVGARIAAESLGRLPLEPEERELAAFMVAEHLLLPDTATRRDLTDENLIMDVAARVSTLERLASLYLLAKADAAATGPAAWTPWRQVLIRELVVRVRHVLERGQMGQELAARLADRVDRVRDLLSGEPESEVDRFVLRMPRAYFLSVEPAQAARHFRTVAPPLGTNEVRTASADGERPGTYEVLVVASDRPGLLSWIAGALAVGGISILSAQVFTTDDGAAVDLFVVEGAFEPQITEARWREFRATLRRTIEGSISLERRVEDKRRRYPSPRVQTPVTVKVDNDASDFSTVIEVGAPDRIGLLHDITRALADLKLDVHLAKVATFAGRVVDAFYVRDALGRKVTDPDQVRDVEEALTTCVTA